jgi:hypothetical protein
METSDKIALAAGVIDEKPCGGFESFPLKLHYSYQPCLQCAEKIEGTRELFLSGLPRVTTVISSTCIIDIG